MSGFQASFQLLWAYKVGLISPSKAVLSQNQPIFFLSLFLADFWFLEWLFWGVDRGWFKTIYRLIKHKEKVYTKSADTNLDT